MHETKLCADDIPLLLPCEDVADAQRTTVFVKLLEAIPVLGPIAGTLIACREKRAALERDNQLVAFATAVYSLLRQLEGTRDGRAFDQELKAGIARKLNVGEPKSTGFSSSEVKIVVDPFLGHFEAVELPLQNVPFEAIPGVLVEAYAEKFDEGFSAKEVLRKAFEMRRNMDEEPRVLQAQRLPRVEDNPVRFWAEAFDGARKADSRMVAALVYAADSASFDERAKSARGQLLERLTAPPLVCAP